MRILVADGDSIFLSILHPFLREQGHQVETAVDGLECRGKLGDFAPDVVVLERDLLWGGADGIRAVMHDDPELAVTPVVLIADFCPTAGVDRRSRPPVAGWLQKPFRLSELTQLLASVEAKYPRRSSASQGEACTANP